MCCYKKTAGVQEVTSFKVEKISPVRVQLVFDGGLEVSGTYIITVKAGIKDKLGNPTEKDAQLNFKTK